jgi:hypothetical protein
MNYKSLKYKIFIIFYIPAIALIYFSYTSLAYEYKQLNHSSAFKLSAHITSVLSNLIHNIQIERGLSAGYIVVNEKNTYQDKLKEQHLNTNKAYERFLKIIKLNSIEKRKLEAITEYKAEPIFKKIIEEFKDIINIREKVLNSSISFEDEISYYTEINRKLILIIKIFNIAFKDIQKNTQSIIELQKIKEYAGLERAYSYNLFQYNSINETSLLQIKNFQDKQNDLLEDFFLNASAELKKIYNYSYNVLVDNKLKNCRKNILYTSLHNNKEADKCFKISTEYINVFARISTQMLNKYIDDANRMYDLAQESLYTTLFLCLTSLLSLVFLTYFLKRQINKEE